MMQSGPVTRKENEVNLQRRGFLVAATLSVFALSGCDPVPERPRAPVRHYEYSLQFDKIHREGNTYFLIPSSDHCPLYFKPDLNKPSDIEVAKKLDEIIAYESWDGEIRKPFYAKIAFRSDNWLRHGEWNEKTYILNSIKLE